MKNKFLLGVGFALISIPIYQAFRNLTLSATNLLMAKIDTKLAEYDYQIAVLDDQRDFYENMDEIFLDSDE